MDQNGEGAWSQTGSPGTGWHLTSSSPQGHRHPTTFLAVIPAVSFLTHHLMSH